MAYHWKHINRKDASFMKGIAMLLILFHNYCHLIKPWNGENEFAFSFESTRSFINLIRNHPENIIQYLFSFTGHYGVQLFVFLSGYGLFRVRHSEKIKWIPFMQRRLVKLYPAYFITVLVYLLILTIKSGHLPSWVIFRLAIADLLFLQSLVPGEAFSLVGPWWFFPMIIQLYMVFPLVMRAYKRWGVKAVYAAGLTAWLLTLLLNPLVIPARYNLNYFFIGHLPVFCLGMILALKETFYIRNTIIVLALLILAAGNFFSYIWPFTMLTATLILSVFSRMLQSSLMRNHHLTFMIQTIGNNSLFIFLVHGFLRNPFVGIAERHMSPLITALTAFLFLVASLIAAILIKKLQMPLKRAAERWFNHRQAASAY